MSAPFFSVVIPTRGRAQMAAQATKSVLNQTFPDFEVIVVDNDLSNDTRNACAAFEDERFIYFRTGDLSMADNWEAGCRQARGEYICILEDKQLYKPRTLERVYELVEADRPQSVRWQSEAFNPYGFFYRVRHARNKGAPRRMPAGQVLDIYLHGSYSDAKRVLPIGHFGCFHRDLATTIRHSPWGRCCAPIEPDYTLAFAQLAFAEEVLVIDEGLVVFSTTTISNGLQFRLKKAGAKKFIRNSGGSELFFNNVPIKAMIIPNLILNDFLQIQQVIGGRLSDCEPDWVNYFVENQVTLQESRDLLVDVREEEKEWQRALAQQPDRIQQAVAERLQSQCRSSGVRDKWKILKRRLALHQVERYAKSVVRALILRDPDYRYRSVEDFLTQEHQSSLSKTI